MTHNGAHCWHRVATRGGQDVYACCHLVQRSLIDRQQSEVCGAVLLPHPGATPGVRTHGILHKDDLYEAARQAVRRVVEGEEE